VSTVTKPKVAELALRCGHSPRILVSGFPDELVARMLAEALKCEEGRPDHVRVSQHCSTTVARRRCETVSGSDSPRSGTHT
jgi:hypothetical protein